MSNKLEFFFNNNHIMYLVSDENGLKMTREEDTGLVSDEYITNAAFFFGVHHMYD